MIDALKRWLKTGVLAALLAVLLSGLGANWWISAADGLPAGDAITDGRTILRYALPIDNGAVRQLQKAMEDISTPLRVSRRRLTAINGNVSQAERILTSRKSELLASVPSDRQPEATALIQQMNGLIQDMRGAIDAQDRDTVWAKRAEILGEIGQLEELMIAEFPFKVPEEYSNLPQLKGRATVEVVTNKGNMTMMVDGYNAPITAGNFVDLVQRGFYDNLPFTRAEESYVLQIGDPLGAEDGFVDPETGQYRTIPLEVLVKGDKEPTYGITLEDAGRYLDQPVLPFSAYGTLGMARPGDDPNGGSSQFFFFLFEPELTPAGLNLLDGRYAVFGYMVEGKEVLEKLKEGDRIESARVIQGAENLVA